MNNMLVASLAFVILFAVPVLAQDEIPAKASSALSESVDAWNRIPEYSNLKIACADTLQWATTIANMKQSGATYVQFSRWAEKEAEGLAAKYPNEDQRTTIVGTNMILTALIRRVDFDKPIYQQIPGGFPQWAYRSCLKGKTLD